MTFAPYEIWGSTCFVAQMIRFAFAKGSPIIYRFSDDLSSELHRSCVANCFKTLSMFLDYVKLGAYLILVL